VRINTFDAHKIVKNSSKKYRKDNSTTGFWERICKSKKMTIIIANMYKVISSTKHCLHLHNNPLLIQILLSPFCNCTEKLINFSKVTQQIRSWADFEI